MKIDTSKICKRHLGQEVSFEELTAARQKWVLPTIASAFGVIMAMAGVAWGLRDWFFVDKTSRAQALCLSILFFVLAHMAGVFMFCLQEHVKVNKQFEQRHAK
jgi:hypothetical protein